MESKIIQERLLAMQDKEYARFMSKLIPDKDESEIIGVRIPDLRKYAKELLKTGDVFEFLHSLPHKFFEEYQLHVLIISAMKDFDTCIKEIDNILPYIRSKSKFSPFFFTSSKLSSVKLVSGLMSLSFM